MEATRTQDALEDESSGDAPSERVYALRSSPDRFVFTEENNCDGWISTDLTVEPRR